MVEMMSTLERKPFLDHEKLDVYQIAIEFIVISCKDYRRTS